MPSQHPFHWRPTLLGKRKESFFVTPVDPASWYLAGSWRFLRGGVVRSSAPPQAFSRAVSIELDTAAKKHGIPRQISQRKKTPTGGSTIALPWRLREDFVQCKVILQQSPKPLPRL
jgi:hypothetical protein